MLTLFPLQCYYPTILTEEDATLNPEQLHPMLHGNKK
jgi:hypothetical protein